jgi:hypothetical protein
MNKNKQVLAIPDLDMLNYDNRAAIELSKSLGRPLTKKEYEKFRFSNIRTFPVTKKLKFKNEHFFVD